MSGITSQQFYPHDPESDHPYSEINLPTSHRKEATLKSNAFLYPIDESEEFHDPFSDLNLYLAKKVKQSIQKHGSAKSWSGQIQADLLNKIVPEFRLKFPRYRLGLSALKKVWEKVMYYSEKVESQKQAISTSGKLNIAYMIQENLRKYPFRHSNMEIHPSNYSYQLAVKLCECIATLDGERPLLDRLTKTIWSVQKHLLPKTLTDQKPSPFDQYDLEDKLIVKFILENLSRNPYLSHSDLEKEVFTSMKQFLQLSKSMEESDLQTIISSLIGKQLKHAALLKLHLSEEEGEALLRLIKRQFVYSPKPKTVPASIYRKEMIQRIIDLLLSLSDLPKDLTESTIRDNLTSHPFLKIQYALCKDSFQNLSDPEIDTILYHCYQLALEIPTLSYLKKEELEILIWAELSQNDLQELPEKFLQILEEEIATLYVETPEISLQKCSQKLTLFFKKIKELPPMSEKEPSAQSLEEIFHISSLRYKIFNWTIQNELLLSKISFDSSTPLLKTIETVWESYLFDQDNINHDEVFHAVKREFQNSHPELRPFSDQLDKRIWILYKYYWYTTLSSPTESAYERFIKYHPEEKLEKITQERLPLTPFSPGYLTKPR